MKALLIRHAEAAHQAADAPLTAQGERQAGGLVAVLTQLGAGPLYASPMHRAQATLAPYASASGQEITVLEPLRERLLSPNSLPDWQDHIAASFEDPDYAPKGGETHRQLLARANGALGRIERDGGRLPTFATHGGLTAALLNARDPGFGFEGWAALRNPDVFEVALADGKIAAFRRLELGTLA